jgi:hypothetical protein
VDVAVVPYRGEGFRGLRKTTEGSSKILIFRAEQVGANVGTSVPNRIESRRLLGEC